MPVLDGRVEMLSILGRYARLFEYVHAVERLDEWAILGVYVSCPRYIYVSLTPIKPK
jgi:hypothetical protein